MLNINGTRVTVLLFILILFITRFSPFLGLYRLLSIYIGKIPISGKNLGISFPLVLRVPPSPSWCISISLIYLTYYTS